MENKNYDLKLAGYIWSILKTQPVIVMSWGVDMDTIKPVKGGLEFHVQGFKHTGMVQIILDKGKDLFEVHLIPDSEGERAANATKFYKKASDKASWVYLGDRSLLAIEAYENNFVKVSVPNRKEFLYVKKNQFKYTRTTKFNSLIEKVIVVDRTNQNTQLFDYVGGEFLLTHSSKSTTGYNNNNNSYRTPRGFYIVSNVKPYMMYFDDAKKPDETKKLGRALYAVRFSGGYYLHGILSPHDASL